MKQLRSLHLYLGCIFAPLLLFFAVSGIWQTLGTHSPLLKRLSTIHTSHVLKVGGSLTNGVLIAFVIVMSVSFMLSTVLGVMLAIKYGRNRRAVWGCLAFGIGFPLAMVLISALK
jgi:hypothetical protein